ncbi:MAG: DUF3369 domain-containing protein [Solirubrobacterales bacterium]
MSQSLFDTKPSNTGIPGPSLPAKPAWKILVVDDDEEVLRTTRWVLRRFDFEGRPIEFLNALSAAEAMQIMADHPDIAVILLDVVMEDEDAGFKVVHHVRRVLLNKLVRIVLRTGQPGEAPEIEVMRDYDINDYKEKTELTTDKLYTAITAALRSYRDISTIDANRRGMRRIIESLSSLYDQQDLSALASESLHQLTALLGTDNHIPGRPVSGLVMQGSCSDSLLVLAGTGAYTDLAGKEQPIEKLGAIADDVRTVLDHQQILFGEHRFMAYVPSKQQMATVIVLEGTAPLEDWEQDLFEVFCMNLSVALDNFHLNQEITDTQKEIIFTLGEVAEARSHDTGQHVKRVAEYARLLALKYGLSQEEAELVRLASPTHDVGKLGISDLILNKPGPLTSAEFIKMKDHCAIGYEMLRKSDRSILRNGALIAFQHHERWDGTGYPRGLAGEEIHIFGRIVALADVLDALGSKRIYKEPWPMRRILEYVKDNRGLHFDPRLVDILLASLDEIIQIGEIHPD